MRYFVIVLLLGSCPLLCRAQQPAEAQAPGARSVTPATQAPPETQSTQAPAAPTAAVSPPADQGYMDPARVKELLHKFWTAEYRINDLLKQIHPDRWKVPDATRQSYEQDVEILQKAVAGEAGWREQFEQRPDSIYLGYETYAASVALLPRLEGLGQSVGRLENASLGIQYSLAENQVFDLQQSLQPYLAFLMRNQDQLLVASQGNLASCQTQLGVAMRGRTEPATPMKNVFVEYKGHRSGHRSSEKATGAKTGQEAEKQAGKNAKPNAANPPPAPAKPQN